MAKKKNDSDANKKKSNGKANSKSTEENSSKKSSKKGKKVLDDVAKEIEDIAKKVKKGTLEAIDDLGIDKDEIKKDIQEGAKKIKDKAKDFAKELDEGTKDLQEDVKETAGEFTKGAKDTYEEFLSDKNSKRIMAGIFAIIFGSLGVHKFILGYTKEGLIMLAATFVLGILSFGLLVWIIGLVGFVEGIIYLTKSDEEFYQTYQVNKRLWF